MTAFTKFIVEGAALAGRVILRYVVSCPASGASEPQAERSNQTCRDAMLPKPIACGLRVKMSALST